MHIPGAIHHAANLLSCQVVVVGSGISGLFTALKLADYGVDVLLLTKSSLSENNSRYAQGGIAAVLPTNPDDSLELHVQDTLAAGAGLCDEAAVRSILSDGYAAVADLLCYGVQFDTHEEQLALTREAAHSVNRILHIGGDATGFSVEMTLIDRVHAHARIQVQEFCQVLQLNLREDGSCGGCMAMDLQTRQLLNIGAGHVVLATGGVGRIFGHTTNPVIATGDGLALAYQAGARLQDLEFVQFHPTAFWGQGKPRFLISEALRGEGGILRDADGRAFAKNYDANAELAPRDVVTRAIYAEMQHQGASHMYLDITHLPDTQIERRFPTILTSCKAYGVDIRHDWIPVSPAAHYLMGGIASDVNGQSDVTGLHVVGESAATGLHGANRLASNSLLECVVLARRVADAIAQNTRPISAETTNATAFRTRSAHAVDLEDHAENLRRLMWEQVGIVRHEAGLTSALAWLEERAQVVGQASISTFAPAGVEYANQLLLCRLLTRAALDRTESRGAHYRQDFPDLLTQPVHSILQKNQQNYLQSSLLQEPQHAGTAN